MKSGLEGSSNVCRKLEKATQFLMISNNFIELWIRLEGPNVLILFYLSVRRMVLILDHQFYGTFNHLEC